MKGVYDQHIRPRILSLFDGFSQNHEKPRKSRFLKIFDIDPLEGFLQDHDMNFCVISFYSFDFTAFFCMSLLSPVDGPKTEFALHVLSLHLCF